MKKNTIASFIAFALTAIGLKELPKDADGKLALDPEQDATLKKEFGVNYEAFKKKANEHLAAEIGADAEKDAAREKANLDLICDDKTPLMYTVKYGTLDFAKLLLENGANKKAISNKGNTALDYAKKYDQKELIKILD